uniref:Uncharacterized protein n=1 Tax=Sphaerodactylus townsendi TaxID=933632 RepID=A0ACB8F5X6_9SAUR
MKRCKSDELQEPEEDSTGAEDVPILATMDAKSGDSAAALLDSGASNPNPALHPGTRSKPPDLKETGVPQIHVKGVCGPNG